MTKPVSLADRLSGLNLRSRFKKDARRRRADRRWQAEAQVSRLEERCMLSGIVMPATPGMTPDMVMSQVNATMTTIKITNNTGSTIYPFMEDSNNGINPTEPDNGPSHYYDYETTNMPGGDYYNQDYRLYAGYEQGGQTFFGVKPGATITMDIPIVFWNAGLFYIAGRSPSTTNYFTKAGIPFEYNPTSIAQGPAASATGETGLVLYYHTTDPASNGTTADAPVQLVEWTIRNATVPNGSGGPRQDEYDYDISNINAIYLPLALEATKSVGGKQSVGYIGTLKDTTFLADKMAAFADGTALNGYFGGSKKGWPYYRIAKPGTPIPIGSLYKIVGAQNVFKGGAAASSYDTSQPQLSSAAGQPPQVSPSPANDPDYAARDITNLWFGWLNYYLTKVDPGAQLTPNLVKLMGQPNVVPTPITTAPDTGPLMLNWHTASGVKTDAEFAAAFATTVYTVMEDFSNDQNLNFASTSLSPIDQFMGFILGDNVTDPGVFPNAQSEGAVLLTQQLIALMRGEPNTTDPVQGQPTPSFATSATDWYPTPANPTNKTLAGEKAKYNLAPFVWFVHRDLDLFSYAYSVDDAYGNTQVFGTSQLQVGVGGPGDPKTFLQQPYIKGE
jgi:hypothetical protein